MRSIILVLWTLLFVLNSYASTLTSRIHSVDHGKIHEKIIVMLTNGRNAFLDSSSKSLIEAVEESLRSGDTVQLQLGKNYNVLSLKVVSREREVPVNEGLPDEVVSYSPSIVSSSTSLNIFSNMRRDYQYHSQCYNRAHIWTYEAFKRFGLKSNKLFLFFTSRYIRRYNYKWWFHVTPMVYIDGTSQSNWRTLDRRYTSAPLTTKTWTNVFMLNDAFCPVVYKYSSYRNHQQEKDCYLIPTSMYFWQPRDIERQEIFGSVKTQYFKSETDYAYWEAF